MANVLKNASKHYQDYEVMSNESESMSQILFITFLKTGEVLTCFPLLISVVHVSSIQFGF